MHNAHLRTLKHNHIKQSRGVPTFHTGLNSAVGPTANDVITSKQKRIEVEL